MNKPKPVTSKLPKPEPKSEEEEEEEETQAQKIKDGQSPHAIYALTVILTGH